MNNAEKDFSNYTLTVNRSPHFVDMSGLKIGKLNVIRFLGWRDKKQSAFWLCECECGNQLAVMGRKLRQGQKSCGCGRKETLSKINFKHGETSKCGRSPEFQCWIGMRARCLNPKEKRYPDYGGRGIKIHPRWMDFSNFLKDMGRKPSSEYSIERIGNNGNYEPGNCKWGTDLEQANNTRQNRFIEFDGKRMTIAQWAREKGMRSRCLQARITYGWPVERALTEPVRRW